MVTGTSPVSTTTPVFHADDSEQASGYRTLSVLAIISLIFGLASPLSLGGPLLKAIPLFGIAVSLLALRRIAVSGGVLAGGWAALAGLMLCVAFAVIPFSRDLVERSIRTHQAEEFGRRWIDLLASGKSEQAFHLTVDGTRPAPKPEPGAPPPKTTPYQDFLNQPIIKELQATGANATIRFDGTYSYDPRTYRNITVRQRFSVTPASASSSAERPPVKVILTVDRARLSNEGMSRWLLIRGEPADSVK